MKVANAVGPAGLEQRIAGFRPARNQPSSRVPSLAQMVPRGARRPAYIAVKVFHSLAFWTIQSAIFYLVYKGLRRESDRGAAIAVAIAGGESMIYAGNGFRCPLTGLAEDLGAESGSVTDIFLPKWLASNVARIYTPLLALGLFLHARNIFSFSRGPIENRRGAG